MSNKELILSVAFQIAVQLKPNLQLDQFQSLDFSHLIAQSQMLELTQGQSAQLSTIIQQEDQYGVSYLIINEGEAQLSIRDKDNQPIRLDNHPFFYGPEYNLQNDSIHKCFALTDCSILVIKESRIQLLLKNYYTLYEQQVLLSLYSVYFLQQEETPFIMQLMNHTERIKFKKGNVIYSVGEVVKGFYLILEGEVSIISQNYLSRSRNISLIEKIIGKNQCFGEIEMLNKQSRKETTKCYSMICELLFITTDHLIQTYIDTYPEREFSLELLSSQFSQIQITKQYLSQKAIDRLQMPVQKQQKITANASEPLFMNLDPLRKFSIYKDTNPRVRSLYQKPQQHRMQSQEVFVNESLAKLNNIDSANYTIPEYIETIKQNSHLKRHGQTKSIWEKTGSMKNSVITEKQREMLEIARTITPLYLVKKRKSLVVLKKIKSTGFVPIKQDIQSIQIN